MASLTWWVNIVDRLTLLVGPFCFLFQKAKEDFDISFSIASMYMSCGVLFCKSLALTLLVKRVFLQRSRSSSSIRPSKERVCFVVGWGVHCDLGYFGRKDQSVSWLRETIVRFGLLIRFHVLLWALVSKIFWNYFLENILIS